MVLYHKRNSETLVYFIGSIVEGINEAPNGYILAKFPSCEFLVVTHEWVSTTGEALGQIGRINEAAKKIQIPEGYIKCDNQITLIERENMNTENGSRYEFWVPIKNNR
jgi:predicted transcriptional regulator YdeE